MDSFQDRAGTSPSGSLVEPSGSAKSLSATPDAPFPYMQFARQRLKAWDQVDNLGMSGLKPLDPADRARLGLRAREDPRGAYLAFARAVAAHTGVEENQVHPALGTSHANFAVVLALARGKRILVEEPAYEALPALAGVMGKECVGVPRDPARGWRLDAPALWRAAEGGAALIAVTDLHNPSGARICEEDYALLAEVARVSGALVLVDEVYAGFDPLERPTAATRGPQFVVTNSLTKVHGLPDLRAGWVIAAPQVIRAIAAFDDIVCPDLPPLGLAEAARYLPEARARCRSAWPRAASRIALVDRWVRSVPGFSWTPPDGGFTGFVRVGDDKAGDVLAERLHAQGITVVPGSFFQRPGWIRVSFDADESALAQTLAGIAGAAAGLPRGVRGAASGAVEFKGS